MKRAGLLLLMGLITGAPSCARVATSPCAGSFGSGKNLSGDPAADAAVLVARIKAFLPPEWTIREEHTGLRGEEKIWICATDEDEEERVPTPIGFQPPTILLSFRERGSAQHAGPSGPRPIGFTHDYDVFGLMWGDPFSWDNICYSMGMIRGMRPASP